MAFNETEATLNDFQPPEYLDKSDLECLKQFNQTARKYNQTAYMSAHDSSTFAYTQGRVILLTVCFPLILIFGVLGNCAFIYVVAKIKHMRTITNRYLVNLAIADVIFLIAAIGPKLYRFMKSPLDGDDSPLGASGCIWTYFLSDMSYFASLLFVTLVSLDRFVAVCRPQDRNNGIKGRSAELITGAWILSCLLAASLTPGNANLVFYCYKWAPIKPYNTWPSTIRYCMPMKEWMKTFAFGMQTLPFFVTLILNCGLYIAIIHGLDKSIKRLNLQGEQKNKDSRMRNQIAKMLVVNGIIFFICLSPFEFVSLCYMIATVRDYIFFISSVDARTYITVFARILSYINSAINPIVYTAMCERYIQAFKQAFVPSYFSRNTNENNKGKISRIKGSNRTCQTAVSVNESKDTNV
ncbi:somatostatin receptor type 5-like [Amphiura filiformis]|uniref:somatostatin receptor type 5-like n=1 Tax=Amphiura filiformis TaxID=82378 RepID=UPI003B20D2E1